MGPSATNEKILTNELAFAALKRCATLATFNLVVWWRSRLGANKFVFCGAVRAVEARYWHGEAITDLGELGQSAPQIGRSAAGGYRPAVERCAAQPPRLLLEIDVGQRLPAVVPDDEAPRLFDPT